MHHPQHTVVKASLRVPLEATPFAGRSGSQDDRTPAPALGAGAEQEDVTDLADTGRDTQTPVSGSSSSTRAAASASPESSATIERTCSCPVASRKVGARP